MQSQPNPLTILLAATFNGRTLNPVEYKDEPAWLAVEVGRALGMADPSDAAQHLVVDPECEEGFDYHRLGADEVAALRLHPSLGGSLSPMTRQAILLTEPGLWRLLGASRVPAGVAFRRWLYRDHLPSIRTQHLLATAGTGTEALQLARGPEAWRAATAYRKAERAAADAQYRTERARMAAARTVAVAENSEKNNRERRAILFRLVEEMAAEIKGHRAADRKVKLVPNLDERVKVAKWDDRWGQGMEPVVLREVSG